MENQKEKSKKELIEQITVDRLDAILANRSFTIIDVRDAAAIENQGSIPGAVNIPYEQIESSLEERLTREDSAFNSGKPLLFCCTGGVMSYMAALKAQEKGLKEIFNLEGGHAAWMKLKESQKAA